MSDEMIVYRSGDDDPSVLDDRTIAVVGYGNLGSAMAANLRDSGVTVIVGNIDDEYGARAAADGFAVSGIADAVGRADVAYVLIPDEEIPQTFIDEIAPALRPQAALCLGSGYSLAFDLIDPASDIDVLLRAPRMLGEEVRRSYVDGTGFFAYISVEKDASGSARDVLLALAGAAGALRRGAMELSAAQEALIDLLVEQTVGPVFGAALITAFYAGIDAGLPPEAMVLEMYMSGEMSRTFGAFASEGFYRSTTWHGIAAQYGGYLRFGDLDLDEMDRVFRETIEDIRSGGFAATLQAEREAGYPTMEAVAAMTAGDDPMTAAEERVRGAFRSTTE
jgi:ketol-acid reductoisomerase